MNPRSDVGQAIALAARTINEPQSLDETLQAITEAATHSVPGFDQVGVSIMRKNGTPETRAFTGDLVPRLDQLQYDLSEGPCVDSLRHSDVIAAPRLRHDQRWPRYIPEAVGLGVKAQLGISLHLDHRGTAVAGLNLYSTTSEDLDPEAEAAAKLFATHAAIALGNATQREQLNEALQSRKVIGQALGILMERYDISEDRAFAFLVRASSHGNVKLREVAEALVSERHRA
ncbi:GAF and ANTAR domain-containing protein [Nocardioides caldifontis]|uniref:GAF and ANTAR domain-containing protein n=1 Tax=Nocardioides caldifontis TaxID=2588938 RepID=UPI0011DF69D3|nr:GAF and ANTAR domain-containing protein [Nocardioides caldifontis]